MWETEIKAPGAPRGLDWPASRLGVGGDWSWRWGVSHHSQRKTQVRKLVVAATVDSSVATREDSQSENGVEGPGDQASP